MHRVVIGLNKSRTRCGQCHMLNTYCLYLAITLLQQNAKDKYGEEKSA